MSTPHSSPAAESPAIQKRARQAPRRQPLSCLPCRQHKLRCDRHVPCSTCTRYRREGLCLQHPAPAKGRQKLLIQHVPSTNSGSAGGAGGEASSMRTSQRVVQGPESLTPSYGHLVDNFHMASAARAMTLSESTISSKHKPTNNTEDPGILFPQTLPLLQFSHLDDCVLLDNISISDQKVRWKALLVKLLPTRTQSDILLSYFIENINWLFQTVHIPTFRKQYAHFWDGKIEELDLIWMSLLFTIVSLSALYIPLDAVELVGLQRHSVRKYAHLWHHAALQALQAGEYDSKPCLTQLQTFSVTQLYWYATNNIEILNS